MHSSSQAHFTQAIYLSTEQANFMTALTHLSALHITGADAENFLQSQLSANVKALQPQKSQFAAWCAASGRVVGLGALGRADTQNTAFVWYIASQQAELLRSGLTKFKLRSKVAMEIDTRMVYAGRAGACPVTLIDDRVLSLGVADADASSLEQWFLSDIMGKLPWFGAGERFLPQMLGLEHLDGLSLKKGCFPGQEVISRMHYKGELKRELVVLRTVSVLAEGAHLLVGGADRIDVLAVAPVESGFLVLAVMPRACARPLTLADGTILAPLLLP